MRFETVKIGEELGLLRPYRRFTETTRVHVVKVTPKRVKVSLHNDGEAFAVFDRDTGFEVSGNGYLRRVDDEQFIALEIESAKRRAAETAAYEAHKAEREARYNLTAAARGDAKDLEILHDLARDTLALEARLLKDLQRITPTEAYRNLYHVEELAFSSAEFAWREELLRTAVARPPEVALVDFLKEWKRLCQSRLLSSSGLDRLESRAELYAARELYGKLRMVLAFQYKQLAEEDKS